MSVPLTSPIHQPTRRGFFVLAAYRTAAYRTLVIFAALVAVGLMYSWSNNTAQAALVPGLSAEQLGRDTLITPTPLSQAKSDPAGSTTEPTISIANTPTTHVKASSVADRSALGVPVALKSDMEVAKPVNPAARQALPKKASYKYILVDLSEQRVYAKEDGVTVFTDLISSGLTGPTPTGHFKIYLRYYNSCMSGPGYNLCNIHYTQYFHGDYSIHEAYWHNNFGHPMSHGCVNMRYSTSKFFWDWAGIGTDVYVRQ